MGIQLLSAIIAERRESTANTFRIVNPTIPVLAPKREREKMIALKREHVATPLRCVIIIHLWGGRVGQEFTISGSLVGPKGRITPIKPQKGTWKHPLYARMVIEVQTGLKFSHSGVFEFKFLLDGEPLVSLPMPIYWEDEFPT